LVSQCAALALFFAFACLCLPLSAVAMWHQNLHQNLHLQLLLVADGSCVRTAAGYGRHGKDGTTQPANPGKVKPA
jgi:hypothetical protein